MSNSVSSKSLSKKLISKERDKNKGVTSESGGSSQCDTPPLIEKDPSTSSQGKYAGVRLESVQCMAEQIGVEINVDAATNLAEDVSYKLRQVIHNIGLHSSMMKKSRVDASDVNATLMLSDTSPVVGATTPQYVPFGDEDLCCELDTLQNITECALTPQSYVSVSAPSLSVEWVTDERGGGGGGAGGGAAGGGGGGAGGGATVSAPLHNYYMKVAKAILSLKRKLKELAIEDLSRNRRIGPILPNLMNLAVLVLNAENLRALHVPARAPSRLRRAVLRLLLALAHNRAAASDTNVQQQFQRLFPMMVSNILSNGSLSDKMVTVLTNITRTWPALSAMGKDILSEYLSKAGAGSLTPPLLVCLTALGRRAVSRCAPPPPPPPSSDTSSSSSTAAADPAAALWASESALDAATCLLRADRDTYLEDYVTTDYSLYEVLGDSILPRRTLFPREAPNPRRDSTSAEKQSDEDFYITNRILSRRSKLKLIPQRTPTNVVPRELVFEPVKFKSDRILNKIQIKVKSFRTIPIARDRISAAYVQRCGYGNGRPQNGCVVASGALNRFRFKLNNECKHFPIFVTYML